MHNRRLAAGATILMTGLVACGNGSPVPTEVQEQTIALRISPATVAFDALGDTTILQAFRETNRGRLLPASEVQWAVSSDSVARVRSDGRVWSVGEGSSVITATTGTHTSTASVLVDQVPDTVVVSPARNPVELHSSIRFEARVLDRLGNDMTAGTTLTWESRQPSVAAVVSPGVVLGVAEDSALVEARAESATGMSVVQVASVDGPNEPEGYTTLNEQPWDALASNGWGHRDRTTFSHIVHDPTAPVSPGNVLEFVYPEGYTNVGTEPAVDYFWLGKSDVYVSFWYKASPGWHGHATGTNKMLFFMNSDGNQDNLFMAMRGGDGGPYSLVMYPQGHTEQSLREDNGIPGWFYANQNDTPVVPGQWHRIEILLNHLDGELRWWMDGELIAEHTGLALDGEAFGNISIAPTWGGIGGSDKRKSDYLRYDDLYISVGSR